jgi:hypothetical protein
VRRFNCRTTNSLPNDQHSAAERLYRTINGAQAAEIKMPVKLRQTLPNDQHNAAKRQDKFTVNQPAQAAEIKMLQLRLPRQTPERPTLNAGERQVTEQPTFAQMQSRP